VLKYTIEVELEADDENITAAVVSSFYIKMLEALALQGCTNLTASLNGNGLPDPIEIEHNPVNFEWGN
jgi:hypothetical protein